MKKITLLLTVLFFTSQLLVAQDDDMRYVKEIFTDVDVQENVIYGVNATILYAPATMEAVPQPLVCDIYTPNGDTETNRPLAIIAHTGNFLPPTFNGGCGGTQKDADVVELAKRLARMGYVAACIDYRLGWDPSNPDQTVRVYTIINAAYRALQDVNTSVKYFRKTVAEASNPYGIDPAKVVTIGFGTGAYATYGASTLQSTTDTWHPPFITTGGPMVVSAINGDVNADTVGVVPAGIPYPFPAGDTLCYVNHPGYDANAQFSVQLGGACGHDSWITAGDTPMASFHVLSDPFAPYYQGIVNVPPPVNLPVTEVFGPGIIIPLNDQMGNNAVFTSGAGWDDAYTDAGIASRPADVTVDGLYTFYSTDPTESAPWNYAYSSNPYDVTFPDGSVPDCPTLTPAITAVRDTVINYFAPRACLALDLGCNLEDFTSTDELEDVEVGFEMMPNPAIDQILMRTESERMEQVLLFDAQGKLIRTHATVDGFQFTLQRKGLPSGLYVALVKFEKGYIAKKISFQ